MSQSLQNHRTRLVRRMMASAGLFTIFSVAAAVAGVRGSTFQDQTLLLLCLLIVASFVLLPRTTRPRAWPTATTPEAQDQLEMMRENLQALQTRATYQRFFYFAIAFLLMGALPLMGI